MASYKMCMIIVTIIACFVSSILAADINVGDESGWKLDFDYHSWAMGKEFHVGDRLVFKYDPAKHNVLRVNGTGFQQCKAPNGTVALTTGNDAIPLTTPGKKWYICGKGNHCAAGMNFSITVWPQSGSPAPSPGSAAPRSTILMSGYFAISAIILGVLMV